MNQGRALQRRDPSTCCCRSNAATCPRDPCGWPSEHEGLSINPRALMDDERHGRRRRRSWRLQLIEALLQLDGQRLQAPPPLLLAHLGPLALRICHRHWPFTHRERLGHREMQIPSLSASRLHRDENSTMRLPWDTKLRLEL
eukprot:8417015-Pyramimonas_sp.AAC.1